MRGQMYVEADGPAIRGPSVPGPSIAPREVPALEEVADRLRRLCEFAENHASGVTAIADRALGAVPEGNGCAPPGSGGSALDALLSLTSRMENALNDAAAAASRLQRFV